MSKQTINIGASPNDGTGTPLRTSFDYTNQNFTELYTAVGPSGNNIVVPGNATITGDLTVDTSTLKVVSASDVVGINTASPLTGTDAGLTIGAIGTVKALNIGLQNTFARLREKDAIDAFAITTNITGSNTQDDATKSSWKVRFGFGNGNDNFLISRSGVGSTTFQDLYSVSTTSAVWSDGAGGTRMTLDSTGLGVGVASPGVKLDVVDAGNTFAARFRGNGGTNFVAIGTTGFGASINGYTAGFASAADLVLQPNGGNVGIGVTPSYKLDVNGSANVSSFLRIGTNPASSGDIRLPNNSLIVGRNAANTANLVMMQLDSSNALKLNEGVVTIDSAGNTISYVTATAPTLANSNMVFNLTSNTNLRIYVKGTDGTTRMANITLA